MHTYGKESEYQSQEQSSEIIPNVIAVAEAKAKGDSIDSLLSAIQDVLDKGG